MSVNENEIFVQTRENARREFSFVDEDTLPLVSIDRQYNNLGHREYEHRYMN